MRKEIKFEHWSGSYTDTGSGEALMLVHGFGEDAHIWKQFGHGLSHKYRVIVPDLPGCGHSTLPNDGTTMELMAEFIYRIVKTENLRDIRLVGHSMGGYISLALMEQHAELVSKLIMFHSHCFADNDEKLKNRAKAIEFLEKHGSAPFIEGLLDTLVAESFAKNNKELMDQLKAQASKIPVSTLISHTKAMMARPDRSAVLQNFKNPVLFILGKLDKAVPYEMGLRQVQYPVVSEVCVLDEVGHCGMIEEPEKCIDIIENFIKLNV